MPAQESAVEESAVQSNTFEVYTFDDPNPPGYTLPDECTLSVSVQGFELFEGIEDTSVLCRSWKWAQLVECGVELPAGDEFAMLRFSVQDKTHGQQVYVFETEDGSDCNTAMTAGKAAWDAEQPLTSLSQR